MPAGYHWKWVIWMESIIEPVILYILFIIAKPFTVFGKIGQSVMIIFLEQFIKLPERSVKFFVVEISVAYWRAYYHAIILHYAFMPYYIRRDCLKHKYRVCSMTVSIVEKLRHPEYHYIIFLFSPRHICPDICHLPGQRLYFLRISRKDSNLPWICVQHSIYRKELFVHTFFHMLADCVKLLPHKAFTADRSKIAPMHHVRNMVGSNGFPMGYSRRAMLISARISAVRISKSMPYQYGKIRLEYFPVHNYSIVQFVVPEIYKVVPILTVMVHNLMRIVGKYYQQPYTIILSYKKK